MLSKLYMIAGVVFASLLAFIGYQRKTIKRVEKESAINKDNADLLAKEKKVMSDLDEFREARAEVNQKLQVEMAKKIEALKHENDDSIIIDDIISLLDNPNETKSTRDTSKIF